MQDDNHVCTIIHPETVTKVREMLPDNTDLLTDLATFYKVFGDPTRLRILFALGVSELCVCDIAASLQMTHSAISHQLRILKQSRLVKTRKEGKSVYYRLHDPHVQKILAQGFEHIQE